MMFLLVHTESQTSVIAKSVGGAVAGVLVLAVVTLFVLALLFWRWRMKKKLTDWKLDVIAM